MLLEDLDALDLAVDDLGLDHDIAVQGQSGAGVLVLAELDVEHALGALDHVEVGVGHVVALGRVVGGDDAHDEGGAEGAARAAVGGAGGADAGAVAGGVEALDRLAAHVHDLGVGVEARAALGAQAAAGDLDGAEGRGLDGSQRVVARGGGAAQAARLSAVIDGVAALTGVGVELLDGDEEGFCGNADLLGKLLEGVGLDVELLFGHAAAGEAGSLAAAAVRVAFVHAGLVEDVPAGFARQAVLTPVLKAAERVAERVVVRDLVAETAPVVVDDDRVGVLALDVQGEGHRGVDLLVVLAQLGVDGVAPRLAHHAKVGAHGLGHAQAAAVVGAVGGEVVVGDADVVLDQLGVVLEAARRQQDAAVRLDLDLVAVLVLGDDADDLGNGVARLPLGDEALAGRVAEDLDAQVLLGGDEGVVEVVAASAERQRRWSSSGSPALRGDRWGRGPHGRRC